MSQQRRSTATSRFGVSRRESHDSSDFYSRFTAPELSNDDIVNIANSVDVIHCADARRMDAVAPASVALVVTSPPYFAGKEYEEELGAQGVPANYLDYLQMLTDVFSECVRKLEPGGRIAVNVANLGRKPYRSLAADVTSILQDRLKLLLRGEIVWQKAKGAGGSCAWGSYQSPSNPVLRDLTERIIVASKGRFDRAIPRKQRSKQGLPSEISISQDDFLEATLDVWDIPPESAKRVGHPAPFPVELPQRLIELYTYRKDLVLDPFMGSGSTAVASVRTGRHFVGYDLDPRYVKIASKRVEEERKRLVSQAQGRLHVVLPAVPEPIDESESFQARAVREGKKAKEIAVAVLQDCGFGDIRQDIRTSGGVEVNVTAVDRLGRTWYFDVSGAFTSTRPGLRRTDTLWKALGKAAVLRSEASGRLVLLTTDLPPKGSPGHAALMSTRGEIFFDAVEMLSPEGQEKLRRWASGATER